MRNEIIVGGIKVGGNAPITIQSMTNTKTDDITQTSAQINRLAALGCDIVRVAVPDIASANAIGEIKKLINIPLVADIHFDHKLAIRSAEAGADKIRINPGNIGGVENVKAVAKICKNKRIPIRIGVNGGSISDDILKQHGGVTAEAMYQSAMGHIALLNKFDFDDICVSAKASSVPLTVASYKLLFERTNYPLHIGVTEAGTEYAGIIKSAVGIGALLLDGVGNTIRVSLTAQPEHEIKAAIEILKSLGLRSGYEFISCPTCGRCKIDLIPIAKEVECRLDDMSDMNISVAVMGCIVNGPGEASRADYGIAGGLGEGILFKKGNVIGKVPMADLVDGLFALIEQDIN
ncbi:MAG: flavodoxin-dependent (E)-4-hydroxy-3-methylbut-2-enyl-diphosphate synthase [Oscillospiraceae bacterium]|nr:flavodoxin-dependent (E)-4-hydroxy-3-methylbut-2-enyl-diphosphate synthase [Oscillospiraceae bacterium]